MVMTGQPEVEEMDRAGVGRYRWGLVVLEDAMNDKVESRI